LSSTATLPVLKQPEPITADGVEVKVITLTAELAEELIAANAGNRNVSEEEVARHCRNLLNNRWKFNGDTWRIDLHGRFIDGQHRVHGYLRAIAMLEAQGLEPFTMPIILVTGLQPEARATIDLGRRRSLADELRMRGYKDTTHLASFTSLVWNYDVYAGDLREAAGRSKGLPSVPELLGLWDEQLHSLFADPLTTQGNDEEDPDLLSRGRTLAAGCRMPVSSCMLVLWILDQVDPIDAQFFIDRLTTGDGVSTDDLRTNPIFNLRRLIHNKRKVKKMRVPSWLWVAWTLRAWHHFRNGQRVENITFTAGGQNPDPYPRPLNELH